MENFAKILPSRRFSAVLGSLVFVIVLVWGAKALSMSKNSSVSIADSPSLITSSEIERLSFEKVNLIDSDEDDLKDWEEILWQTDPKNPDTDSDGTNDGEEIKKNRDPKVKGPSDTLHLPVGTDQSTVNKVEEKLTTTDLVARDFFSKYLAAKQSGQPIDSNISGQIASSVLTQTKTIGIVRLYSQGDLIIDKNDNTENLKSYGEKMGSIIKNTPPWKESELEIIKQALEREDESILKRLDPIINGYTSMREQMLKITVPEKAIPTHLDLLNAMEKIISSLKSAQNVFKDPVTALTIFGKYSETITGLHRVFIDIRGLFQRNNITYDSLKNDGYYYANFADLIELSAKKQ
ncbi:MAG: hypothetical protein AAB513_01860 [Patescibacteria group bacterium]